MALPNDVSGILAAIDDEAKHGYLWPRVLTWIEECRENKVVQLRKAETTLEIGRLQGCLSLLEVLPSLAEMIQAQIREEAKGG